MAKAVIYNNGYELAADTVKIQDHILLRRAIHDKDREALGRLHSIYYLRIKRYITSRIGDITDTEDLTQSVFLELCKGNGTYNGRHDAEAYLLGIAKHLIALYYRDLSRQIKTISMECVDEIAADIQQKPTEHISQRKLQYIKDLMAELPSKTKEAISLRLIEKFSIREAAKHADCSIHTFCQRIYEAKKIIKKSKPSFDEKD